jgi:ATPase subunit of ABC transporter with duplicated ATPase domains
MLIVSHDRELLDMVDQIGELRAGQVRWYGGNLIAYEAAVAVEQEAAERAVRAAESDVQRQKRELIEARIKLDRRLRYGQKMQDTKRVPKILANELKRQAQVSAGKLRATLASLLLAEPAPQLLLLDEPTNNLDMASVRQLSGALRSYQGALIVASHDVPFLRELGLTRWLRLDGDLVEIDPL